MIVMQVGEKLNIDFMVERIGGGVRVRLACSKSLKCENISMAANDINGSVYNRNKISEESAIVTKTGAAASLVPAILHRLRRKAFRKLHEATKMSSNA